MPMVRLRCGVRPIRTCGGLPSWRTATVPILHEGHSSIGYQVSLLPELSSHCVTICDIAENFRTTSKFDDERAGFLE